MFLCRLRGTNASVVVLSVVVVALERFIFVCRFSCLLVVVDVAAVVVVVGGGIVSVCCFLWFLGCPANFVVLTVAALRVPSRCGRVHCSTEPWFWREMMCFVVRIVFVAIWLLLVLSGKWRAIVLLGLFCLSVFSLGCLASPATGGAWALLCGVGVGAFVGLFHGQVVFCLTGSRCGSLLLVRTVVALVLLPL